MVHANHFTIAAVIGIAAFVSQVSAGGVEEHQELPGIHHRSYLTVGGTRLSTDDANTALTNAGFHTVSDYAVQLGGGFGWHARRLLGGAELFGYIWQKKELATTYTRLYGLGSRLTIGVNVLPEGPFLLYPQFSFGLGGLGLKLGKDEVAFDTALAAPINNVDLWQRTFVLAPGIGFDYRMKKRAHPGKFRVVGIRAGYAFDVSDNDDWRSDWVHITGGPKLRASGPFLRLVVGKSYTKSARACCKNKA